MVREEEYVFEDKKKEGGFGKFLWNSRTKEFLGRDGASWAKVSMFYAIFYLILGSFFVGMIAVFYQIMPKDRPTYYGPSSVMASRSAKDGGANPGLGFRPQVDVEDWLIRYQPMLSNDDKYGMQKYIRNVNNFLDAKYDKESNSAERFNHREYFASTPCSSANNEESQYAYDTPNACILIKLNKIVQWQPKLSGANGTVADAIAIRCGGEFSADKDNLKSVTYHSEGSLNNNNYGMLKASRFPYDSAVKGYEAPFIWVQFDITPNTLVNIDCKAYADNIDTDDRMNRRGQTKFTLYVKTPAKKAEKQEAAAKTA